jgi:uncharacterized protein (TIGR03437 family)
MLNRSFSIVVILCVAASAVALGQTGQDYLFQFATPPNTLTSAAGYVDNGNLGNPTYSITGPSGLAAILPTPDGTKFYLVGTAGPTSLQVADSNFDAASYQTINGLGASCGTNGGSSCGAPTAATITPDGKYLLVSADQFYVFSTATNAIVATIPINGTATFAANTPGPTVCISCWIATTADSQYAYLLTTEAGSSVIAKISLTTLGEVGTLNLRGSGTSLSMSPLGELYETVEFGIYVIDPIAFTAQSGCSNGTTICLNFQPGPMRYTQDGTTGYVINLTASTGGGVFAQINLATEAVSYWNPSSPPQFTDILIASPSRIFAYAAALGALYDVSPNPLSATVDAPSLVTATSGILQTVVANEIITAAVSNEFPGAQWLFLLVANGNQTDLYRVTISNSSLSSNTLSTFTSGVMETTYQPATTGATTITTFNNNQTIATNGATSLPLIGQVLNTNGLPVFGQSATFSTNTGSGLVINTPTAVTNAKGFVQTTVTVPAAGASCTAGACTVTLTAGAATSTFTVTVPVSSSSGSGGTGGTGGSTTSQMTIVSGDGQLLPGSFGASTADPLTVLVTSTTGTPLANVPVTFGIGFGAGNLSATAVTTGTNGEASVNFIPSGLSPGFTQSIVTASTTYGSVNFTETVYALAPGDASPLLQIITPSVCCTINVTAGTTLTAGIQAQIVWQGYECPGGGTGCAIPGVGIQLLDPDNIANLPTGPQPVLKCQGSTDSNTNGVASCNVVAAVCPVGGGETHGIIVSVGNLDQFEYTAVINPGGADTLTIISGNKQTGNTGAGVTNPLVAEVLDACGNPVSGAQVTWKVTQGSATLSQSNVITSVSGLASTSLTFGQTAGPVTVTITLANGSSATFTLTSQAVATSFVLSSGGTQTATTGQPFTNALTFTLTDKSGNPVAGATATFTVTSGSATLSPTSTTTNAAGQAQTTVTAGATAGSIVITASAAGLTATANLTSTPPGPTLTASSFVNAASFTTGLVPCGLAVVMGNGVAPGIQGTVVGPSFGPLPYDLGPISSLTIGGIPAPLSSVTNENGIQQATFQTPCELSTTSSTTTVAITVNGVSTNVAGVSVLAAQPGIFTFAGPNNIQYGAVISATNSSYVTPSNFAVRGQTYYVIVTGLGQTTPASSTDNPGDGQTVNAEIIVGVNNAGVGTGSATYAPGLVGAYLVPFTIPLSAPTGANQALSVAAIVNGQVIYSNSVFIPGVQ